MSLQNCVTTLKVLHACRRLISSTRVLFDGSYWNEVVDDENHRHAKQILRSGLRFLGGDITALKDNVQNRGLNVDIDELVTLHKEYNRLIRDTDQTRHRRNENAKKTRSLPPDSPDRDASILLGRELKAKISELEGKQLEKERALYHSVVQLPNHTHPTTPIGGQDEAKVVYVHGKRPEFNFKISDHIKIGERLDLFDFESAARVSGSSFYYLKGMAAELELALIHYAIRKATGKGFTLVLTPDVVKSDVVEGCGFQPRGEDSTHIYQLHPRHHGYKCLAGTAEIPLAGMFMDKLVPLEKLPSRIVAFGRCFRAEAGHGKYRKGLYRVHQFSKVELFGVTANESGEESEELLQEIVEIQKEINNELGFHYQVLEMPTEELGIPAYRKFDIEVWMPGMGNYGEVTSASNCTDFQSRRLGTRYLNPDINGPSRKYAHTVNGTACAIPRTIVALLENYQQEDGTVSIPDVLHPYVGKTIS